MGDTTATVEVLTAEVRTLMVGSRQVTLSVAAQLDVVPFDQCEPFGRIRLPRSEKLTKIIGADRRTGALVVAQLPFASLDSPRGYQARWLKVWSREHGRHPSPEEFDQISALSQQQRDRDEAILALPLIVLAGLR